MRGPERVVHIDVGQLRELPRKVAVVLLLLRMEAEILEQDDLAAARRLLDRRARGVAD
jgi:hypothetical protein